jgi:hypothetical protein
MEPVGFWRGRIWTISVAVWNMPGDGGDGTTRVSRRRMADGAGPVVRATQLRGVPDARVSSAARRDGVSALAWGATRGVDCGDHAADSTVGMGSDTVVFGAHGSLTARSAASAEGSS